MLIRGFAITLVAFVQCIICHAGDWPSFRGPTGNGISPENALPAEWGSDQNIVWKVALPHPGNGSPIVCNGRVFLTVANEQGTKRSLYCFDRNNGDELWVRDVALDKAMPTHKTNPHGSSTPVSDGKHVVAWHNSAGLYCYDFSGKKLWSRDLGEFKHMWGYGSSPVIYKDHVILNAGPGKRVFVTAINLENGETLWEKDEPQDGDGQSRASDKAYVGSWSTPIVTKINGSDQIVCTMPTRVNGYDPASGDIIWSCDGIRGPKGDLAYSSPLIADGFCVAFGGFKGPAIGLKIEGTGNLTDSSRVWRREAKNPQSIGSGVFLDGHVFRANAGPGTIECLDPKTGKAVWSDRAAGDVHWGSVVSADGKLYVINQSGTTIVFKPNPKRYEEIARNELRETCNTTPALSDGQIFIRTYEHLYCIGKSP